MFSADEERLLREHKREWLIRETIPQAVPRVLEDISQLEFYLKILEEFVNQEERKEVSSSEQETANLLESERSEFWQNNYPFHWDYRVVAQLG